jgi:hypothetical protein
MARPTGNQIIAAHGSFVIAGIGALMVVAGIMLAASRTPESALIWSGGILIALSVVADRLTTFELGREGGKLTLAEKNEAIKQLVEEAQEEAPTLAAPALSLPIAGSYWSDPAFKMIQRAYGSNSRAELNSTLSKLYDQISAGTAVVNVQGDAAAPKRDDSRPGRPGRAGR